MNPMWRYPKCAVCILAIVPAKKRLWSMVFAFLPLWTTAPLTFAEFEQHMNQVVFVSATPGPYEREHSEKNGRTGDPPTGLVDPKVIVRPVKGQIDDLLDEIGGRSLSGAKGCW